MRLVISLLSLLWASSVQAGLNDWKYCGGGGTTNSSVGAKECIERSWTNEVVEGFSIRVLASTALITFEPHKDGSSQTATVQLRRCLAGYTPTDDASSANSCISITDAAWNGAGGGASNQKFAERVGPGLYWVEILTAGGSGDTPFIQVQGD